MVIALMWLHLSFVFRLTAISVRSRVQRTRSPIEQTGPNFQILHRFRGITCGAWSRFCVSSVYKPGARALREVVRVTPALELVWRLLQTFRMTPTIRCWDLAYVNMLLFLSTILLRVRTRFHHVWKHQRCTGFDILLLKAYTDDVSDRKSVV